MKLTNKKLNQPINSYNLIGNHLLKSIFITKIKKKEKQKIYKTKYKKTKVNIIFLNYKKIKCLFMITFSLTF